MAYGAPFFSTAWCNGYCPFDTTNFQNIRSNGVIPVFSWSSANSANASDPNFTDQAIANGTQDSFINSWADSAKAWGHPLFLRFDWEMNGNWFPWGLGTNGNSVSNYVAMWQHVHQIFVNEGATNVSWVWCPNINVGGQSTIAALYPGDGYVDWTGLDAYNTNQPWTSFHDLVAPTYATLISVASTKPMMIPETGSTESGGSKAQWITDMFAAISSSFPDIYGLMWYDLPGAAGDNQIESSAGSITAFTQGIADSHYMSNKYATLTAPIPKP